MSGMAERDVDRPTDGLPAEDAVAMLKAAGEPTRLRILLMLRDGDLTVSDMVEVLGQSQPRVSRHLRLLVESGLAERYQEGAWAFYRLREGGGALAPVLERLSPEDAVLARDAERLAAVRAEHRRRAAEYFARNAADWDRIRALHAPEAQVERAMLDLVGPKPVRRYLDLGTGTGRLLELFAPLYARGEALGLDSSREMLAIARARLEEKGLRRARVRHGDILAGSVPRGACDLVTMHQVLHFLDRPREAVSEAAGALAPGGRLLVVDFAPHAHEFLRERQAHSRLGFAPETVSGWLEAAGARSDRVETVPPTREGGLTVLLWLASRAG